MVAIATDLHAVIYRCPLMVIKDEVSLRVCPWFLYCVQYVTHTPHSVARYGHPTMEVNPFLQLADVSVEHPSQYRGHLQRPQMNTASDLRVTRVFLGHISCSFH